MADPIQRPVVRRWDGSRIEHADGNVYAVQLPLTYEHNALHDYTLRLEPRIEGLEGQLAEAQSTSHFSCNHIRSELEKWLGAAREERDIALREKADVADTARELLAKAEQRATSLEAELTVTMEQRDAEHRRAAEAEALVAKLDACILRIREAAPEIADQDSYGIAAFITRLVRGMAEAEAKLADPLVVHFAARSVHRLADASQCRVCNGK